MKYAGDPEVKAGPNPVPTAVAWLGYGGLLPFLATASGSWLATAQVTFWQQALLAYGAVILAFVGALHWAFAMAADARAGRQTAIMYLWSKVPALAGWSSLLLGLLPGRGRAFGMVLLMVAFLIHYQQDRRLAQRITLPDWYLPLRRRLTTVASICLLSCALSVAATVA